MEKINNKVDHLFREIRKVVIYNAKDYSFSEHYRGEEINAEPVLSFNNIIPDDFERDIKMSHHKGFISWHISYRFQINATDVVHRAVLYRLLNKREFALEFYSNEEKTTIGNDLHPMMIEVEDEIKEDGSGTDAYIISVYGDSITSPMVHKI
ncbi:hypothetical protein [Bergeyella zoohelcum]|uniref:Uncharacterized protein n=1 Tax=Bergeyella zoohelcum TaxID=1015 RepID=A0A376C0A8_9FLAO|nr:hypothetical protein [Bergeyella zoohelcum]EKB60750.1 hypothetical protein HMPREF9700_00245 [Bergeyella zoohelcum CCUG 30536]SSZ47159.1 Uncharacterised protein [Bergeyella zoohelcum]